MQVAVTSRTFYLSTAVGAVAMVVVVVLVVVRCPRQMGEGAVDKEPATAIQSKKQLGLPTGAARVVSLALPIYCEETPSEFLYYVW